VTREPGDPHETDTLVRHSREGDPRALTTLYHQFAPALLEYLERILGERSDAEDLLHESFLRIFQGRGRYDGRGRFRQWLFTVATRLARDRLRRGRRRREILGDLRRLRIVPGDGGSGGGGYGGAVSAGTVATDAIDAEAEATGHDPAGALQYRELLDTVEAVLAEFPPAYTSTFHLRIRDGFSYGEIAAIEDEPVGTLRSRVHHVLNRLRRVLTADGYRSLPSRRERKDIP